MPFRRKGYAVFPEYTLKSLYVAATYEDNLENKI